MAAQDLIECFGWRSPGERLSWSAVEGCSDRVEFSRRIAADVRTFWEQLPPQAVGIPDRSTLSRISRIAEVRFQSNFDPTLNMLGLLRSLVPGKRPSQWRWQDLDLLRDGVAGGLSAATSEDRPSLNTGSGYVLRQPWQMQQQCESRGALDQRTGCGAVQSDAHVTLPVTWYSTVRSFGGALIDHHFGRDKRFTPLQRSGTWYPQCPARTKAGREIRQQCAASVHVQRLVDGFVGDPHARSMREVDRQSTADRKG